MEEEEEVWRHAAEAAAIVRERRKARGHPYYKEDREEEREIEDTGTASEVVVVLVGLPGTGKSTFCRDLADRVKERGLAVILVDYDSLIPLARQVEMVGEDGAWKKEREAIVTGVEQLLEGKQGSGGGYLERLREGSEDRTGKQTVVLVDDNNYLASMRLAYYRLARNRGSGFCQFYFQADPSLALRWNSLRPTSTRVPDTVISSMATRLEVPRPADRTWEQCSVTVPVLEGQGVNMDLAEQVVLAAFRHPVPPLPDMQEELERREVDRAICDSNMIHRVDVMVRGLIKTQMASRKAEGASSAELRQLASRMGEVKVMLLEQLRRGDWVLGEEGESQVAAMFQANL